MTTGIIIINKNRTVGVVIQFMAQFWSKHVGNEPSNGREMSGCDCIRSVVNEIKRGVPVPVQIGGCEGGTGTGKGLGNSG